MAIGCWVLRAAGDYIVARELKVWGENIIRQGIPRLAAVLRVFVICKVIAWVIRTSNPCTTLMSQSMVIRGFSSSCVSFGGWLEFVRPKEPKRATRARIGGKAPASSKGKRKTVFATKYASQITFRGRSNVLKTNVKNTGSWLGNHALSGRGGRVDLGRGGVPWAAHDEKQLRVRGEIMGPGKYENVRKSQ